MQILNPILKFKFLKNIYTVDLELVYMLTFEEKTLAIHMRETDMYLGVEAETDEDAAELELLYGDIFTKWRAWREFEIERRYAYIQSY